MNDPIAPTADEMSAAQDWWDAHLAGDDWPFSLQIDGVRVADPTGWTVERATREPDPERQELTLTARHPDHGLVLRCVAVRYRRHPVMEWTLHLEQTDTGRSPMVSEVLGVDATWQHTKDQPFLVRTYEGDDHLLRTIYQPIEHELSSGQRITLAPTSNAGQEAEGRCSGGAFPYLTVEEAEYGRNFVLRPRREPTRGFFLAIGWPGRWSAEISQAGDRLRIQAGQDRVRFRLEPGESYRAPLIALCFFQGPDRLRAMNLWRRWMLAHNLPRLAGGALPPPMLEASTCGFFDEMGRATEANQIEYIDRFRQAAPDITHWWMDAGWYPCRPPVADKNKWWITGTWEIDPSRFPRGLRPISDHAHAQGIRTILWFEPERVAGATWLFRNKPQWLLRHSEQKRFPPDAGDGWDVIGANCLLDLGNPEARAWLVERVASLLASEGIDVYRQDFNFNPLPYWRDNDRPGREGLTEQRHNCGYLAYWDELRRRFPAMLLDSCASGGRRLDLQTMRRGVALHPTDHAYQDMEAKQTLRHSLFGWLPFFGGPVLPLDKVDVYAFRSTMGLSTVIGFDLRQEHDLPLLRKLTAEWREVAELYYGDYYPLTRWTLSEDAWMAWQFHRHEQADGLIQVFRRRDSPIESACFPLHGLDPAARYVFHDFDVPGDTQHLGADLAAGWRIAIPERRTARLIRYRRQA
jgi:alpha-galactosidase